MSKEEKPKAKMGRPSIYSEELAERICKLVATHSFGIKKLCKTYPDLPDADTIRSWCREKADFSGRYAQAKRDQADLMAEEIIEIADDGQNDYMECIPEGERSPGWKLNGEHVQRSRLRMDARKWLASKLVPKIYGTRTDEKSENGQSEIEKMLNNE